MGKKVERDILDALRTVGTPDISQLQTDVSNLQAADVSQADTNTVLEDLARTMDIHSWYLTASNDARGSLSPMDRGAGSTGGTQSTEVWSAKDTGIITDLYVSVPNKITNGALSVGVTKDLSTLLGGYALTLSSGQTVAAVTGLSIPFTQGFKMSMLVGGSESLAPNNAVFASFSVKV